MTAPRPPQPPVMQLIQKRRKQSIRQAALAAGISEARWRQLESGARSTRLGYAPEPAPPGTLARMAHAVGVTAAELRDNGEEEAAAILEELAAEHAAQAEADEEAAAAGARAASEMRGLSARQRAALAAMIAEDLRALRGGGELIALALCGQLATLGRMFFLVWRCMPGEENNGREVLLGWSHSRHRRRI